MLEIIGYACAVIIGISLGMIGGGGSVLTVPVLAYLMGIPPVLATAYSLFIVGSSSLIGGLRYAKRGDVDFRTAIIFGIPSIAAVYLTRMYLVPAIPQELFSTPSFTLSKDMFLMVLFAGLMLFASVSMIKPVKAASESGPAKTGFSKIAIVLGEGLLVGTFTGLVGAGGGFLIIPALVVITKIDMKRAVGTSLLIISSKSLIGFAGDVMHYTIDWQLLLTFSSLAILGIFIGSRLSTSIDDTKLKIGFGWFILLMGVFIILKELLF